MKLSRIILALLTFSCGASIAGAQDRDPIGSICEVGRNCPVNPGSGGGGGIDPSPYDPQPGHPGHGGGHPGHGGGHHNPGHGGYPSPDYPDSSDRREVYVGQYLRDQNLNLLSLMNLDVYSQQGTEVLSVEVFVQNSGRFSMSLVADGYLVAQNAYAGMSVVLNPNRNLILGQTVRRSLSLAVRGQVFVERVVVNLRSNGGYQPNPNPYPGPGQQEIVLQGSVYQSFYGPSSVDIGQITNLMAYRGYQIASITVNGRSTNYNQARARLLVNGTIEGDLFLGNYDGSQMIYPRGSYIVGRNLNAVTLLVDGGTTINSVQVRLVRF